MASALKEIAARLKIGLVYKTSFDKANRTSAKSARGIGLDEALPIFADIRDTLGIPVLTDVHEIEQCARVADAVDVLQIPAFLCRQTDLLIAAAKTGRTVNVKKGQFLAPWDMKNVVTKLTAAGNRNVLVTERGVSFGYNTLVSDMRALPILARDTGAPVIFDATHSGAAAGRAGHVLGRRARIRAGTRSRRRRGRRRRRVHRDAPGSGQGAVRRAEHGAAQGDGRLAAPADGIRSAGQEFELARRAIPPIFKIVALVVFAQTIFNPARSIRSFR